MTVLDRFRAWLRRRETGPIDPSEAEAKKQDAMAAARPSSATGFQGTIPPNYVPDQVDEGRPRH